VFSFHSFSRHMCPTQCNFAPVSRPFLSVSHYMRFLFLPSTLQAVLHTHTHTQRSPVSSSNPVIIHVFVVRTLRTAGATTSPDSGAATKIAPCSRSSVIGGRISTPRRKNRTEQESLGFRGGPPPPPHIVRGPFKQKCLITFRSVRAIV